MKMRSHQLVAGWFLSRLSERGGKLDLEKRFEIRVNLIGKAQTLTKDERDRGGGKEDGNERKRKMAVILYHGLVTRKD